MELILRLKQCCEKKEDSIRTNAGLNAAEYHCLKAIPIHDDVSSKELARGMGLSPSRTSRIVDTLVRRELLERTVSARDRRASTISLTQRGRSIKLNVERCLIDCDNALRARLSAEELEVTIRGLSYATRAIEETK